MSKLILYVFEGSVWASPPQIAADELGYGDQIQKQRVNLAEGENFQSSFLKLNPQGTLPTLETSSKVYTSTVDVVQYLLEHAPKPAGKSSGTDLIERLHDDSIDPNFSLLCARNEAELKAKVKASNGPAAFVRGRQATLERIAPTTGTPEFKAFYDAKIAGNGHLVSLYNNTASPEAAQNFFTRSTTHWKNVALFLSTDLPPLLPTSGFIGGDKPGEDDFHLIAYLARTIAVCGGRPEPDGVHSLENELGGSVPKKVVNYWKAWTERESWKAQYAQGLH